MKARLVNDLRLGRATYPEGMEVEVFGKDCAGKWTLELKVDGLTFRACGIDGDDFEVMEEGKDAAT